MNPVHYLRSLKRRLVRSRSGTDKYEAEVNFWRSELDHLEAWYLGVLPVHYRTPSPKEDQRIVRHDHRHSAILSWFELHQKPKYRNDLHLAESAFHGLTVVDIGAGPMPSGEAFDGCDLYCLDPLYPQYLAAGWPLHLYGPRTWFVTGHAERMPLETAFCDAMISVNAIDHVDDFEATAKEIRRVLKPGGKLCMHIHYHRPTRTEPLHLNDEKVKSAFDWCPEFRKREETREKASASAAPGEVFTLWTNLEDAHWA